MLTKNGRVETTNYRTIKVPSNVDVPTYVKGDFARFYKSMFAEQAKKEENRVAFTEYFWDMSWCDPCAPERVVVGAVSLLSGRATTGLNVSRG